MAMQIFAKSIHGKTYVVDTSICDNVVELRKQLEIVIGTQAKTSRILYGGKQLDDSRTLDHYNIQTDSTISLVGSLCGGIIEPSMRVLAMKVNCDKKVCRKCYATLPPRAETCRKRKCGHSSNIRPKKELR
uniref:Ubiquitin-ribosomal protein eL40 fusion protein n=1 Tax=Myxobolus squamalis TaxID=59785 RepID=A0A6B2G9W8_MYXSQ